MFECLHEWKNNRHPAFLDTTFDLDEIETWEASDQPMTTFLQHCIQNVDDGSEATLDPTNMSYVNGEQPDVVQNSSENDVEATMRERCDAIFERDNQKDVTEATLRKRCDEKFDRNNPDDDHFDDRRHLSDAEWVGEFQCGQRGSGRTRYPRHQDIES